MKPTKACCLLIFLLFFPACSQVEIDPAYYYEFEPEDDYVPPGAYADYGDIAQLRYYKSVLPPKTWKEVEVLDYSEKRFPFPPLAGYRMLQYKNPRRLIHIDLYREILHKESFLELIARRQGSDHCNFTRSFYNKLQDMDVVQVEAECHIWLEGLYKRKYYFLKTGDIIYTFRLLSAPDDYLLAEPDFDYFVSTTIDNYLIFTPRNQISPYYLEYATAIPGQEERLPFSTEELNSFFASNNSKPQ